MPFLFIVIGLVLLVVAFQNTYQAFFKQLASDVPGFLPFAAAVIGIGLLGYIPKMQTPSRALLALVFTVLFLTKDKGVFAQFLQALSGKETAVTPEVAKTAPVAPGPFPVVLSGGASASGAGGIAGLLGKLTGSAGGGDTGPMSGATDILGGSATGAGFGGGGA